MSNMSLADQAVQVLALVRAIYASIERMELVHLYPDFHGRYTLPGT